MTDGPEVCIAIDIGGTSLKSCLTRLSGGILERSSIRQKAYQERSMTSLIDEVIVAVHLYRLENPDASVAIATNGLVDLEGYVHLGPYFAGYDNFSWSQILRDRIDRDLRVTTLNDGQAAALGIGISEYSGDSVTLAAVSIGTGVGGGLMIDGRLHRGVKGLAGLIGHIKIVAPGSDQCLCSGSGCVESYASGRAMVSNMLGREASPDEIPAGIRTLCERQRAGDSQSVEIVCHAARALGRSMGNLANVLNLEVISMHGGVVTDMTETSGVNRFVEIARDSALAACFGPVAVSLQIVQSTVSHPALVGAASLSFQQRGLTVAGIEDQLRSDIQ